MFANPFGTYDNSTVKIEDFREANKYYYEWLKNGTGVKSTLPVAIQEMLTNAQKHELDFRRAAITNEISNPNSDIRTKPIIVSHKDSEKFFKYDSPAKRIVQLIRREGDTPATPSQVEGPIDEAVTTTSKPATVKETDTIIATGIPNSTRDNTTRTKLGSSQFTSALDEESSAIMPEPITVDGVRSTSIGAETSKLTNHIKKNCN